MPGPPPTPLSLKILRGNPGKRPLRAEPQPTLTERAPEVPAFVDGYAADEWRRVAPELYRLGLLSMLDTGPFAAYCVAYQHWRTAEEVLSNDDHPLDAADQRRLTRIAANAARDMIKYASEFGMTPAARSRLAGVVAKPAGGKFDGLIG